MTHPSTLGLALVATDARPDRNAPGERIVRGSGPGWFDSSWELQHGLDVREDWSQAGQVRGWIEDFLAAQRTSGRTASPSASTAIA